MAYLPKATPINAVKTTTETRTSATLTIDDDLVVNTTVSGYYELTGELIFNHNIDPAYSFHITSTNATILGPLPIPTTYYVDYFSLSAKQTAQFEFLDETSNFTYDVGGSAPTDTDTLWTSVKIGPGVIVSSGVASLGIEWGLDYANADPLIRTQLREGSYITLTRIKL